uniref:Uncharacterized protein n=1 Tax=Panagrolaimus sp. ES5 TaxID=591445 RepID=A0AC34FL98_9BILA
MTTKDYCLSFKDDQNVFTDDQYNNLNLNQNNLRFPNERFYSKDFTTAKVVKNYAISKVLDVTDSNDLKAKKESKCSWNKSNNYLSSSFSNLHWVFGEQNKFKGTNSVNSSTLSLHITAYENSNEADTADTECRGNKTLAKKLENIKQGFVGTSSFTQNPFEFPRQQEDQKNHPELMQFKASQRLLIPKEENSSVYRRPSVDLPQQQPSDQRRRVKTQKFKNLLLSLLELFI